MDKESTETSHKEGQKSSKHRPGSESKQLPRQKSTDTTFLKTTVTTSSSQAGETIEQKQHFVDIFAREDLLEDCLPIFLSQPTQEIFNIRPDENISKSSPLVVIPKAEILKDMQMRAAVSDFSVRKQEITDYPGTDILLVYDADLKFGENFVICLGEPTKEFIMNPIEGPTDSVNETGEEEEDEEEEEEDIKLDEESDAVTYFIPKFKRPWIDMGSDREILEASVIETRPKIYTIFQKPRIEFGASLNFTDRSASEKGVSSLVVPHDDKAELIPIIELDKAVTNAEPTCDKGTNTNWKYPRNAFTQYAPRTMTIEELQAFYVPNGPLHEIGKLYKLFEQGLLQNSMFDFLADDYENLGAGDETYDSRADNTFKEFLSFTDLRFSKDKAITDIQWHPTLKGIIATSVAERLNYDQRIDQSSRILITPTHIIVWSFADPLQPQLLLEAPDDIWCFQFNPTDPHIVAGGCINGQVVLWDIEKYMDQLRNTKGKLKPKNKLPIFIAEDMDMNKVPIVPYCCLSNIEATHTSPIMDLKWVPDHMDINRLGYCYESRNMKCVQLITSGLNNELLFWDTRIDKTPLAVDKTRDAMEPSMNVPQTFAALDMKWKPFLRVHLYKADPNGDHVPTKFSIREVQGDRRLLSPEQNDQAHGAPQPAKPLQGASTHLYVGTDDGDLVCVDWMPQKDPDTGKMQTPRPEFFVPQHDGSICFLGRSPFEPSILLMVGGWTFTLWKEGVSSGPILESGHAPKPLTAASWSPTRPSVFYICRADGSLEVWDLMDKTHEPAMVQSVSANALTSVSLWNASRRQLIAIGDTQGALQLFIVPRRMKTMLPSELQNFNNYITREVNRREFVVMRWNLREQERIAQEIEKKRKAGIAPAHSLTKEELLQKELVEYEQYLSEEHAFLRVLGLIEEGEE